MNFKKALLATVAMTAIMSTPSFAVESANGFTYPPVTHTEAETTTHNIVFFYSDDMLSFFDGNVEKLVAYAQRNVKLNNEVFKRQDISLRRNVAAVLPLPASVGWDDSRALTDSIKSLKAYLIDGNRTSLKATYDASYFVVLNKKYSQTNAGLAQPAEDYAIVIPSSIDATERTLMHELGHNDGLAHTAAEINNTHLFAAGTVCEEKLSVMSIDGDNRSEYFFSSPDVFAGGGEPCGDEEHDSALFYKKTSLTKLEASEAPFANNVTPREKSGSVGISVDTTTIAEGENFGVNVIWDGASVGDTVQLLTQAGTATSDDYQPMLVTLTYNGESRTAVVSSTINDDTVEDDKTFSVTLVNSNGVDIDEQMSTVELTVESEDVSDEVVVTPPPSNESDSGGSSGGSSSFILVLLALSVITRKVLSSRKSAMAVRA